MRNSVLGNFSVNIMLFFIMIFLLICSYKVCIPVLFCAIFWSTLYGYNIVPTFVIFSLLFDAYIGSILGITCCMFIALYLQAHRYQYALKNAPVLYQVYYFLRMLINAECVGIVITLIVIKNVRVGEYFFDTIETIAIFIGLKLLYNIKLWWKYAKIQ